MVYLAHTSLPRVAHRQGSFSSIPAVFRPCSTAPAAHRESHRVTPRQVALAPARWPLIHRACSRTAFDAHSPSPAPACVCHCRHLHWPTPRLNGSPCRIKGMRTRPLLRPHYPQPTAPELPNRSAVHLPYAPPLAARRGAPIAPTRHLTLDWLFPLLESRDYNRSPPTVCPTPLVGQNP
jgi:hypothetical protein